MTKEKHINLSPEEMLAKGLITEAEYHSLKSGKKTDDKERDKLLFEQMLARKEEQEQQKLQKTKPHDNKPETKKENVVVEVEPSKKEDKLKIDNGITLNSPADATKVNNLNKYSAAINNSSTGKPSFIETTTSFTMPGFDFSQSIGSAYNTLKNYGSSALNYAKSLTSSLVKAGESFSSTFAKVFTSFDGKSNTQMASIASGMAVNSCAITYTNLANMVAEKKYGIKIFENFNVASANAHINDSKKHGAFVTVDQLLDRVKNSKDNFSVIGFGAHFDRGTINDEKGHIGAVSGFKHENGKFFVSIVNSNYGGKTHNLEWKELAKENGHWVLKGVTEHGKNMPLLGFTDTETLVKNKLHEKGFWQQVLMLQKV